jgi:hypothetical protein
MTQGAMRSSNGSICTKFSNPGLARIFVLFEHKGFGGGTGAALEVATVEAITVETAAPMLVDSVVEHVSASGTVANPVISKDTS